MGSEPFLAQSTTWVTTGAIVGSVFWICIAAIAIIPSIHYWRHHTRQLEIAGQLKQQMIERGYTPAEILAVLQENPQLLPKDSSPPQKPKKAQDNVYA